MGGEEIERARTAIEARAWADAYAGFRAAGASELTARDIEGLAQAAWWLSKIDEALDLRHKAYSAYVAAGDERGAAGAAARLAIEHFLRDEASVGGGFLMRAHRHAEGIATGPQAGFLAMLEATVARFTADLDRAVELAERAIELGRRHGVSDLVAMAVHTEGPARPVLRRPALPVLDRLGRASGRGPRRRVRRQASRAAQSGRDETTGVGGRRVATVLGSRRPVGGRAPRMPSSAPR